MLVEELFVVHLRAAAVRHVASPIKLWVHAEAPTSPGRLPDEM
jgi:hypothetical protein